LTRGYFVLRYELRGKGVSEKLKFKSKNSKLPRLNQEEK
jgi:hypothetical protein